MGGNEFQINFSTLKRWYFTSNRYCSSRSPWKAIVKLDSHLASLSSFQLGTGSTISFWKDIWSPLSRPLAEVFPSLFRILLSPSAMVADLWDAECHSWSIAFRRNLKDDEIETFTNLLHNISSCHVGPSQDVRVWNGTDGNLFSCKSAFRSMFARDPSLPSEIINVIWKGSFPKKVKVLLWTIFHGGINTNDKIQRRFPSMALCPNWCCLCCASEEDPYHLFWSCPFTAKLWSSILDIFSVHGPFPNNIQLLLHGLFCGVALKDKARVLWCNAIRALFWLVWWERNKRIFTEDHLNSSDI